MSRVGAHHFKSAVKESSGKVIDSIYVSSCERPRVVSLGELFKFMDERDNHVSLEKFPPFQPIESRASAAVTRRK